MSVQTSCPDPFLNLVTGVYVINLDQRPDRWEKIQRDVSGIIPSDKITRSPAVLGRELPGYGQRPWFHGRLRDKTWAARAGCALAHRQALELGTSQSTGPIMVLEDDIFFAPESSNVLPKLGVWLRDHSDEWDICYLGYTDPVGPSRQLTELPAGYSLHEVFGCNCAHAYVVNKRMRDHLLSQLPKKDSIWTWLARNRAIDRWYLHTLGRKFKVVALSPCLVQQASGFSDIVGRKIDYLKSSRHQVAIPTRSPRPVVFYALRGLRIFASQLNDVYDWLRSCAKRLRGF